MKLPITASALALLASLSTVSPSAAAQAGEAAATAATAATAAPKVHWKGGATVDVCNADKRCRRTVLPPRLGAIRQIVPGKFANATSSYLALAENGSYLCSIGTKQRPLVPTQTPAAPNPWQPIQQLMTTSSAAARKAASPAAANPTLGEPDPSAPTRCTLIGVQLPGVVVTFVPARKAGQPDLLAFSVTKQSGQTPMTIIPAMKQFRVGLAKATTTQGTRAVKPIAQSRLISAGGGCYMDDDGEFFCESGGGGGDGGGSGGGGGGGSSDPVVLPDPQPDPWTPPTTTIPEGCTSTDQGWACVIPGRREEQPAETPMAGPGSDPYRIPNLDEPAPGWRPGDTPIWRGWCASLNLFCSAGNDAPPGDGSTPHGWRAEAEAECLKEYEVADTQCEAEYKQRGRNPNNYRLYDACRRKAGDNLAQCYSDVRNAGRGGIQNP
jgi:hypothetical protein